MTAQAPLPALALPISSRPHLPLAAALALALSLAVLVVLLAPARTLALGHTSACPRASSAQTGRRARACAKPVQPAKTHARHATRRHGTVRHAVKRHTSRHGARPAVTHPKTNSKVSSAAALTQVAAICEDGSEPALAGEDFACADGSEPGCEDGSELSLSSDGAALTCPVAPEDGSGSSGEPESVEQSCEEVTIPETASSTAGPSACEAAPSAEAGD
jgi:hypothetical protein